MSKKVLIAVGVLVLLGVGAFFFTSMGSNDSGSSGADSQPVSDSSSAPVLPANFLTYPALVKGTLTDSANPENNGEIVMKYEDADTWEITVTSKDGTVTLIRDQNTTYFLEPVTGRWYKTSAQTSTDASTPSSVVSAESSVPKNEDFEKYRAGAVYKGKQPCSAGTCDTWEWTDPADASNKAIIKIDSQGRLSELEVTSGSTTTKFTYDFSADVKVEIPTVAVDFTVGL